MWNKRPLLPNFLQDFDKKLLLNKPEIWSARAHLVLYYGGLYALLLILICFIIPNDPRSESTVGYWLGFTAIISSLAFIVWLIYLLRFNVFKRFGQISAIGRLQTFGLYFVVTSVLVLVNFIPMVVEKIKANMQYNVQELVADLNTINDHVVRLEYDSLDHTWSKDTFSVVDEKIYNQVVRKTFDEDNRVTIDTTRSLDSIESRHLYTLIDTSELKNNYTKYRDSLIQVNDSVYVIRKCPTYAYLHSNRMERTQDSIFDDVYFYDHIIKNHKKQDLTTIRSNLNRLLAKYNLKVERRYYYESDTDTNTISGRYHLGVVQENMDNIQERMQYLAIDEMHIYVRIWFYFSLIPVLLVFAFRHSTVKAFFLSLLTGILLFILSALFVAFSRGSDTEVLVLALIILYALIFGVMSFSVFKQHKRYTIAGISINLFSMLFWILPLVCTALYYKIVQDAFNESHLSAFQRFDYEKMARHIQIAEVISIVFLIVLIPTVVYNLYRKWYALPED